MTSKVICQCALKTTVLRFSFHGLSYAIRYGSTDVRDEHFLPPRLAGKGREWRKMKLPPLPSVQDLLRIYRLRSVRQLAQNFIINEKVASSIAMALGPLRNSVVYEIGPGTGVITRAILKQGAERIVCIEKDFRFLPILSMLQSAARDINSDIIMYTEDCLTHDFSSSSSEHYLNINSQCSWNDDFPNLVIMGNLPFNVSLPFVVKMFHDMDQRRGLFQHGRVRMAFTFQKEVAEQFVAEECAPKRGRLSLMAQNMCDVTHVMNISNRAFVPKPECETGLVVFKPRKSKLVADVPLSHFEKLVKAIMHYKSKHFYKGLRDLFPKQVASYWALQMCTEAQVSSNTLPRNLTFEQLQRIAQIYYSLCQKYQDLFEFNYQQPNRHIPLGLLNDSKHLEETSMRKDEEEILSYDTSWDHEQIDADDEAFLELTDDNNEFLDNDESIFIR